MSRFVSQTVTGSGNKVCAGDAGYSSDEEPPSKKRILSAKMGPRNVSFKNEGRENKFKNVVSIEVTLKGGRKKIMHWKGDLHISVDGNCEDVKVENGTVDVGSCKRLSVGKGDVIVQENIEGDCVVDTGSVNAKKIIGDAKVNAGTVVSG